MTTSSSSSKVAKSIDLFKHQLGTGTWSWGDRLLWNYGKGYGEEDVQLVFNESLKCKITFFDTSETYGSGSSERLLGKFLTDSNQSAFITTKFMPYPWRISRGSMRKALEGSLKRLGLSKICLYQIHYPSSIVPNTTWIEELAELHKEGLIEAIGICNFNIHQTEGAIQTLSKHGLNLASIQVEYNLLERGAEKGGLLSLCVHEGIRLIAYSPLAQGLLTGKYSLDNPPGGIRHTRFHSQLQLISPVITALRKLGDAYDGKTPAAIALNWTMRKGTLPIPGAKNNMQLRQNADALGWTLSDHDMAYLDEVSDAYQLGL